MTTTRFLPGLALLLATLLGAPAQAGPPKAPPPAAVVATIAHEGGRCPDDECRTSTTFHADGRFTRATGAARPVEGKVAVALVDVLRAQIARADFAAIKTKPFTGTCPKAWDGQEDIYVFRAPRGEETLRSCKYALDPAHPLLAAARRLEDASR